MSGTKCVLFVLQTTSAYLSGWHSTYPVTKVGNLGVFLDISFSTILNLIPHVYLLNQSQIYQPPRLYQQLLWTTGIGAEASSQLLSLLLQSAIHTEPGWSFMKGNLMLSFLCLNHFWRFSLLTSKHLNPQQSPQGRGHLAATHVSCSSLAILSAPIPATPSSFHDSFGLRASHMLFSQLIHSNPAPGQHLGNSYSFFRPRVEHRFHRTIL